MKITITNPADRPLCPRCGVGTIELVLDGEVGRAFANHEMRGAAEVRMTPTPFGACNACEYCIEIRDGVVMPNPDPTCQTCDGGCEVALASDSDDARPCPACAGTGRTPIPYTGVTIF